MSAASSYLTKEKVFSLSLSYHSTPGGERIAHSIFELVDSFTK